MSEAPERCVDCPMRSDELRNCPLKLKTSTPLYVTYSPGPACPFVRLDLANVEIAENADDYQTAIVGMQDALDEKDAELEELRAVNPKMDLPAVVTGYKAQKAENERLRAALRLFQPEGSRYIGTCCGCGRGIYESKQLDKTGGDDE